VTDGQGGPPKKTMLQPPSTPPPTDLVAVSIETVLGARYEFPDVSRRVVEDVITNELALVGNLTLVNVSHAALVLPVRIIKILAINGEVKWRGIAFVHELQKSGQ